MKRLIRNLRVLWRAESLIASLKLQRASRRGMLLICACLVGLFGVAMLNVAGFLALQPGMGAVEAALLVAAADFLLAVLTIVAARTVRADPELELAVEVRDVALEEVAAEFEAMQAEIRSAREDFASIKSTVTSFIHRPLDSPLLAMVLPLVKSAVRSMRPGKEERADRTTARGGGGQEDRRQKHPEEDPPLE
jgi:hypothetical protein